MQSQGPSQRKSPKQGGVAHGGLHATLLDTAMGGAVVSSLDKEEWCATAQLDISCINAAKNECTLLCTGTMIRREVAPWRTSRVR